jgi:superfamily II DNA or RNA helicase
MMRCLLSKPLRDWQLSALSKWQLSGKHGIASVVTGGGKTLFALACMRDMQLEQPGIIFIIVVPTVALLDQWAIALIEDLGVRPEEIQVYGGGSRSKSIKPVNLMVINTARKQAPVISAKYDTMLIVDECHRVGSPSNALCLQGSHNATLGLSATPKREWDSLFEDIIQPALGSIIIEYGYNEARRDGAIAPFQLINVEVGMSKSETENYNRITHRISALFKKQQNGGDVEEGLKRQLMARARLISRVHSRLPMTIRLAERHSGEKLIVFHEDINAANILCQTLLSRSHRTAVYHSGLGMHLRQDNLRLFRKGQIDILVTCRALDEGISVSDASVGIIAASTATTRQRIQRLGRVLRPFPGKQIATIYTIYTSPPEEERLSKEAVNLEGAEKVTWLTEVPKCPE